MKLRSLSFMVVVILSVLLTVYGALAYTAPDYTAVNLGLYLPSDVPVYTNVVLSLGSEEAIVADSCTYTSGDWIVQCNDFCNITSDVDVTGDIFVNGTGTFFTTHNITATGEVTIIGGCTATCQGGCFT